jgi:hypothetical protein
MVPQLNNVVCNDRCTYEYKHCLKAIIRTIDNNIVQCTIRLLILKDVLPTLMQLAYETYLQKKETTMYILHDFQVHGKFRLNEDNVVLHIISTENSNDKQVR